MARSHRGDGQLQVTLSADLRCFLIGLTHPPSQGIPSSSTPNSSALLGRPTHSTTARDDSSPTPALVRLSCMRPGIIQLYPQRA